MVDYFLRGTPDGIGRHWNIAPQSGKASLDFGATPVAEATVYVNDPNVQADSHVHAWLSGTVTVDNQERDHMLAGAWLKLTTSSPDQNTGFTIRGDSIGGLANGAFNVNWSYT